MEFFPRRYFEDILARCRALRLPESLAWNIFRRAVRSWWDYRELCDRDPAFYMRRLERAVERAWRIVASRREGVRDPNGLLYWCLFDGKYANTGGRPLLLGELQRREPLPSCGVEADLRCIPSILASKCKVEMAQVYRSLDILRAASVRESVERKRKARWLPPEGEGGEAQETATLGTGVNTEDSPDA